MYVAVIALMVACVCGQDVTQELMEPVDDLADTDLVLAFVIGKQRSYRIGQYIRRRYDGFLSKLYLPDEIKIRTTDYDRTKMTALAALAAIYPPPPAQRWNPNLDWQPVPYDTLPYAVDDLLYWYNCPRYLWLRDRHYELPEVVNILRPYQNLFNYLSEKTGSNITTPEAVFYLDSLFQTLENVNIWPPKWATDVMPQIKEMTKIEYAVETYSSELLRLAAGVLMTDIVNATNRAVAGYLDQPKMRLYSAHENNVAAVMAAVRAFQAHQPNYGATFSLELRKHRTTGRHGIAAVYSQNTGQPEEIVPIQGCGGGQLCDYDTFLKLVQDIMWSPEDFRMACPSK
ncbi:hypothetical protein MSG28_002109 [Choristoneura fumiferana]|uniref:Uncharacterized protein n=1 Tax=Choristoneura fumiferana TaxID=7141 RepID=A0ACC0JU30_CHOFU|nr:hypothetical protein MSG28_002109 [Choristoneura fumiferana]